MSLPGFTVPPLKLQPKRQSQVPFRGNVAAGAYLTLVSNRISYPFRIIEIEMIFSEEAWDNIEYRWFTSANANLPTGQWPSDDNIFGRESPSAGFRGKSVIRNQQCNIEFPEGDLFLKLCVFNAGNYAYQFNASMTIQEL